MTAADTPLTAQVSLNGASQTVRPGLADTIGQRGPAAFTMTMRVDLDAADLAALMLVHLDSYYGTVDEFSTDATALRIVATRLADHGLGADLLTYRDAIHLKAAPACEPQCARLPGDRHDEECVVPWCLTRAQHLLAAENGAHEEATDRSEDHDQPILAMAAVTAEDRTSATGPLQVGTGQRSRTSPCWRWGL